MSNLERLRKAAVLIDALDAQTADALLEQMPPAEAAKVRSAIMNLDPPDPAEQEAVLAEFLAAGGKKQPASKPITASAQKKQSLAPVGGGVSFGFLQDAQAGALAEVLKEENPQMIAVVVSHLNPEKAATVLQALAAPNQTEVLRRIAQLEEMNAEVLQDVEQEVESLLRKRLGSPTGMNALSRILGSVEGPARQNMLRSINLSDNELAAWSAKPAAKKTAEKEELPPHLQRAQSRLAEKAKPQTPALPFDDLMKLNEPALACLLREAKPATVLLALTGAPGAFVQRILKRLPRKDAKALKQRIENPGPLRLRDMEAAQQELGRLALELAARGLIVLPVSRPFAAAA